MAGDKPDFQPSESQCRFFTREMRTGEGRRVPRILWAEARKVGEAAGAGTALESSHNEYLCCVTHPAL